MNKFKFTQGDWKADNTHCRTAINCGEKHVCMVNCGQSIEPSRHISVEEHEANVRLIANAPKLLEVAVYEAQYYCEDCIPSQRKDCQESGDICEEYTERIKLIEAATGMKIEDILE